MSYTYQLGNIDKIDTTSLTASGTATLIPMVGRCSYIKLINTGSTEVVLLSDYNMPSDQGYPVAANGGTWEDSTNAKIYILSTGSDSVVKIYTRTISSLNTNK